MIKMSVYYPAHGGSKFDHDYYCASHLPLIGAPWESLQYYPLRDFWRDGKQMISA